jgi:hypothetical protein
MHYILGDGCSLNQYIGAVMKKYLEIALIAVVAVAIVKRVPMINNIVKI